MNFVDIQICFYYFIQQNITLTKKLKAINRYQLFVLLFQTSLFLVKTPFFYYQQLFNNFYKHCTNRTSVKFECLTKACEL